MSSLHSGTGLVEQRGQGVWSALLNQWRSVMAITLVCILAMLGWSLMQPKIYTATASGIVLARGQGDLSSEMAGHELARSKATSFWSLAISEPVAKAVIQELNLNVHHGELIKGVVVETPTETAEVHVTVEADSPEAAVALANSWVDALAQEIETLERADESGEAGEAHVTLQPLSAASLILEPASPRIGVNTALGLFIGLTLGFLYAFVRGKYK